MNTENSNTENTFDHGTHKEFVEYYAKESLSESTINRMRGTFNCVARNLKQRGINQKLNVADIGCNTGAMSMMWAEEGHSVHGLDVNEALIEIAKQRAHDANLAIEFHLGSATNLPWPNECMDVCISPELLEHVVEWKACLTEFVRVLKPNGVLFISTSNKLCPIQQEFTLPLYSWYPSFLKRHYEKLALTTRPEIAGYAKYPAVNWFSFYQLRKELSAMNMESFDRFDIMDIDNKPPYQKMIIALLKSSSILRWFGHVASPGLSMIAIKKMQ